MWIYMNDSFLSIVRHRDQPQYLMVRARRKGDIEAVFPAASVDRTPVADYRYRAVIHEQDVSRVIASRINSIEYDNFKDSVKDPARVNVYHQLWATSFRLGEDSDVYSMYNEDHFKRYIGGTFEAEEIERRFLPDGEV